MDDSFKPAHLSTIEAFYVAPWLVATASQQGPLHYELGLPLQDAYDYGATAGCLWLVMADGIGQAAHAELGSAAVVRTLRVAIGKALVAGRVPGRALLVEAFADCHVALVHLAKTLGVDLRTLSTTLTCALLTPSDVFTASIGDSSIMGLFESRASGGTSSHLVPLCSAARSSPPATDSIADADWRTLVVVNDLPAEGLKAIVLTSDGAEKLFRDERGDVYDASNLNWILASLDGLAQAPSLAGTGVRRGGAPLLFGNLLGSVLYNQAAVNEDDRTILLALRPADVHVPPPAQPRSI